MKRKVKIAFIIDSINSIAGTEKQLIQTMNYLNRDNFDIKLICLRQPSATYEVKNENFEYIELDVPKLFSLNCILNIIRLSKYLKNEKIDIVQTFFFDSTVFGVLASKVAGVKNIITSRRDLGFWYTPTLLLILRFINLFTSKIIVNSLAVMKNVILLEKVPDNKICVMPNCIDINLFINASTNNEIYNMLGVPEFDYKVGIVANLNRYVKRIDVFIRAVSEVLTKMNNVSFFIVGDGHLRAELEALAKLLDTNCKIHFLGRKNEIQSIIKAWDIGILSSDSEGFSNSILEYMASGLPVIATKSGGNDEIIVDGLNGYLVSPGDYHMMAEKIYDLLNNDIKRLSMSKNAIKIINDKYSLVRCIKDIETFYQVLCQ